MKKATNAVSKFREFFSDDICDFLEQTPPSQSQMACSSSDSYQESPTHSLEANLDELLVQYQGKELKEVAADERPHSKRHKLDTATKQRAFAPPKTKEEIERANSSQCRRRHGKTLLTV